MGHTQMAPAWVKNWLWLGLLVVGLLIIGVSVGWLLKTADEKDSTQQLQQTYSLLSKRILIDNPNDTLLDFRPLKSNIQKYIDENIGQDNISLYFEYLPTGSSIGFSEDKELIGASLLKLPVVINVYKLAEEGKINLDESVALKKDWLNSGYGTLYERGEGYKLTIREAVRYALEQSDNTAAKLLFDVLVKEQGSNSIRILDFVDANYAVAPSQTVLIGSQSYSSIIKCLYFSCYLSKDDSQQILRYLTMSSADNRLVEHLPTGIVVAHKIGSYEDTIQSDCGVVYLDKRNYMLCIMVQGSDHQASEQIAELSKIVYDAVSLQKQ